MQLIGQNIDRGNVNDGLLISLSGQLGEKSVTSSKDESSFSMIHSKMIELLGQDEEIKNDFVDSENKSLSDVTSLLFAKILNNKNNDLSVGSSIADVDNLMEMLDYDLQKNMDVVSNNFSVTPNQSNELNNNAYQSDLIMQYVKNHHTDANFRDEELRELNISNFDIEIDNPITSLTLNKKSKDVMINTEIIPQNMNITQNNDNLGGQTVGKENIFNFNDFSHIKSVRVSYKQKENDEVKKEMSADKSFMLKYYDLCNIQESKHNVFKAAEIEAIVSHNNKNSVKNVADTDELPTQNNTEHGSKVLKDSESVLANKLEVLKTTDTSSNNSLGVNVVSGSVSKNKQYNTEGEITHETMISNVPQHTEIKGNSAIKEESITTYTNVRLEDVPRTIAKFVGNVNTGTANAVAKITLNPKGLGGMFVEVSLNDTSSVTIRVENIETMSKLNNNINALKDMLSSIGMKDINIKIEQFASVVPTNHNNSQNQQNNLDNKQNEQFDNFQQHQENRGKQQQNREKMQRKIIEYFSNDKNDKEIELIS